MADPKGIYFAPNNQGFATILPERRDPNMLDYVQRGMMHKAAQKRKEEEDKQKRMDDIKAHDAYRFYAPALTEQWMKLISDVGNETIDPISQKQRSVLLTQLSESSLQMKAEDERIQQMYKQNDMINEGTAFESFITRYRNDKTIQGLMEASQTQPDAEYFLKEVGGSANLNEANVMKNAVDTSFSDWMVDSEEGKDLLRQRFGYAINHMSREQLKIKAKAFASYDEKTGRVVAMDPDQLIEAGALDAFKAHPYSNRVIEDRAIALHEREGMEGPITDITRARVLKDMLAPFAQTGEVDKGIKDNYVSDRVPYQAYGDSQRKNKAVDWITDASRGEPEAWSFVEGGKYQGKMIIEAKPDAAGKSVDLVLGDPVAPNTKGAQQIMVPQRTVDKDGNVRVDAKPTWILPTEQKTIDLGNRRRWNDEALLEFYRGNVPSAKQPDYGEARAKQERRTKTGRFDNIGQGQ